MTTRDVEPEAPPQGPNGPNGPAVGKHEPCRPDQTVVGAQLADRVGRQAHQRVVQVAAGDADVRGGEPLLAGEQVIGLSATYSGNDLFEADICVKSLNEIDVELINSLVDAAH